MSQPNDNQKKPTAEELLERAQSGVTKDPNGPTETERGEELRPKKPEELETPTIDVHGNAR